MRTSLSEIKNIEDYLLDQQQPEDKLVFEARMILNKDLQQKTEQQHQLYKLVRLYGRKKLRQEIEAVQQKLFSDSVHHKFRHTILNIFNPVK